MYHQKDSRVVVAPNGETQRVKVRLGRGEEDLCEDSHIGRNVGLHNDGAAESIVGMVGGIFPLVGFKSLHSGSTQ